MASDEVRPAAGRGIFYTRDSGGKAEMTPSEYVRWAAKRARELGLRFDGSVDAINGMIRSGASVHGDIYLDFDVTGNLLRRTALDALHQRIDADRSVSHVFIPRRDRLARPDNPTDGIQLEIAIRGKGVAIVFMDRTVPALAVGDRMDIGELITTAIDYHSSGEDRRELAQKMIHAQLALAREGYSTGGRPCYAFSRWLVRTDGTLVRELQPGERVRMAGHHVIWMPKPADHPHMITALRIRAELRTKKASRIARDLTKEGIPAPDAGRTRRDNGICHPTSGVWHQTTVTNIGRNPLLAAVTSYGLRSMGDQLRFSPDGPRPLTTSDMRNDGARRPDGHRKVKVVRNASDAIVHATGRFEPVICREDHDALQHILDQRSGSQRGKARSRNPHLNPLGTRVYDMDCGWPMYREPIGASFRYKCGLYTQSHGAECNHNHVNGPNATRFALSHLRACCSPSTLRKLEARLSELARNEATNGGSHFEELNSANAQLQQIKDQLRTAKRNLALAKEPIIFEAVAEAVSDLTQLETEKSELIRTLQEARTSSTVEEEVELALRKFRSLAELADSNLDYEAIGEAFAQINLRIFLRFDKTKKGKRFLNSLVDGILTFGSQPAPIEIYAGVTGREKLKSKESSRLADEVGGDGPLPTNSGQEGKSLGNVSRGDRIFTQPTITFNTADWVA